MKLEKIMGVRYFGGEYRGECPTEAVEQATFFSKLRRERPALGSVAIHPRNEAQLRGGQFRAITRHKAEGMNPGASDIIIPGAPTFVCELKRRDRTKSKWQPGQQDYLRNIARMGCFACVAFGADEAWKAFLAWENDKMSLALIQVKK